jgi:hypothetical protein
MLAILAGFLIGISLVMETLAFHYREFGTRHGMPTLGYSLHVQLATLARAGTLVGLPLLGWMLDHGQSSHALVQAPAAAFSTFAGISGLSLAFSKRTESALERVFRVQAWIVSRVQLTKRSPASNGEVAKVCRADALTLQVAGAFSFILTAGGLFGVMMSAALAPAYRATILQLSPLVTSIGTVVSVTIFDPKISTLMDRGNDGLAVVRYVTRARLYGALLLMLASMAYRIWAGP